MKSIILLAMLVVGFASCDTPSTTTGNTELQADSNSMNKMSADSATTTEASKMNSTTTDTSAIKKDTLPK